jgi:excinuclease ABC subunit B
LKFEEFESLTQQTIFVSATPADYELNKCEGIVTEQIIRPTGLLDPQIVVRPSRGQIDDLIEEIQKRVEQDERTLVTTLTKRMAEELTTYLSRINIRCAYIHSDVETMDRIKILDQLRAGEVDVLIGVNLLREGLDLPEVSLVAIIDADKEGFLRSHRSLTQTAGRAARNLNGMVIMYADKITESMQKTIDETDRRRTMQLKYNEENNITPQAIIKARNLIVGQDSADGSTKMTRKGRFIEKSNINPVIQSYIEKEFNTASGIAADPVVQYMSVNDKKKAIERLRVQMIEAAKRMDFIEAAQYRDELLALEESLNETR